MVHFKRKPVLPLSLPSLSEKDTELWVMPKTGEVFTSYETYLKRLDFYRQKRFTCDITGHSGLTFFDALESETEGSREVDSTFPDPLKEPLLRKVQFSTISRLDDLVTHLHDVFKEDFFPGEHVNAFVEALNQKLVGVIRDKAVINSIYKSDGTVEREGISRYIILASDDPPREVVVNNKEISRDRRAFSKQVLRSFLKNKLHRESWSGAPWLVKEDTARRYGMDTTVPANLQHDAVAAEKKAIAAMKKEKQGGKSFSPTSSKLKLLAAGSKARFLPSNVVRHKRDELLLHSRTLTDRKLSLLGKYGASSHPHYAFADHFPDYSVPGTITSKGQWMPLPAPVKYPIEDLKVDINRERRARPSMKFFAKSSPHEALGVQEDGTKLHMDSIGAILEIWNTLNVHCEVFQLDSFTFDDFADAMAFSSEDVECELFVEIHCAVLKLLVDEQGHLRVDLPDMPEEDDSDEESSVEDSTSSTPTFPPPHHSKRNTMETSSIAGSQDARTNGQADEPSKTHQAAEMLATYPWVDRLKLRDFRNGGWQVIMIGLLHQLSLKPNQTSRCEQVLSKLAPIHLEPTQETARRQYSKLDIDLRVVALEIACILAVQTKTLREYIEECGEQMTAYRKEKIEWQRERKAFIDELRALDDERKLLLPDEVETVEPAPVEAVQMNLVNSSEQAEEDDSLHPGHTESEDEEPHRGHSLRRGNDRANERKRKRDEDIARKEQEKKARAETAKSSKESVQLRRVLRDIQKKKDQIKNCEDHIATLDGDLRENSCQRTKVLGIDRFYNRYYWFERNGMPFGGLPTSSTSHYGYANGRLWIQGPDNLEREGFLDLKEPELSQYRLEIGLTVYERKALEEGSTSLVSARQWGFYDSPDALDELIAWLDDRGKREKDLRKELQNWRERIAEYMEKLNQHLAESAITKANVEDPIIGVATRKKTYVDQTTTRDPCLSWRNTYALDQLGHLHIDEPRAKKKAKGLARPSKPAVPTEKLSTRSGTRYARG